MKQRKIPMRTCIVTREKCEKMDLVRIVRTPEGNVEIDLSGKKNGRGAYLKKDLEVFNTAKKNKILERVLEVQINDEFYEELNNILK